MGAIGAAWATAFLSWPGAHVGWPTHFLSAYLLGLDVAYCLRTPLSSPVIEPAI